MLSDFQTDINPWLLVGLPCVIHHWKGLLNQIQVNQVSRLNLKSESLHLPLANSISSYLYCSLCVVLHNHVYDGLEAYVRGLINCSNCSNCSVYVAFPNTFEENVSSSFVSKDIVVSKNESTEGPISEVNLRFGCREFNFSKKFSCDMSALKTQKYHPRISDTVQEYVVFQQTNYLRNVLNRNLLRWVQGGFPC